MGCVYQLLFIKHWFGEIKCIRERERVWTGELFDISTSESASSIPELNGGSVIAINQCGGMGTEIVELVVEFCYLGI